FKDSILSLVASVQLSSNDMMRVGDWIEMPSQNADGDVIDMALNTVKVQNWDKTITTIPTYKLISESFKNWRGMQESGGRRIKRAGRLGQSSVGCRPGAGRARRCRSPLSDACRGARPRGRGAWNRDLLAAGRAPVNTRRVTNVGTSRPYVGQYRRAPPGI